MGKVGYFLWLAKYFYHRKSNFWEKQIQLNMLKDINNFTSRQLHDIYIWIQCVRDVLKLISHFWTVLLKPFGLSLKKMNTKEDMARKTFNFNSFQINRFVVATDAPLKLSYSFCVPLFLQLVFRRKWREVMDKCYGKLIIRLLPSAELELVGSVPFICLTLKCYKYFCQFQNLRLVPATSFFCREYLKLSTLCIRALII